MCGFREVIVNFIWVVGLSRVLNVPIHKSCNTLDLSEHSSTHPYPSSEKSGISWEVLTRGFVVNVFVF